ncbi:hypothetical protein QBC38DRAFT_489532 [Podospora fimiseda]|uniref:Mediator of RNA polymerase II transcription subunit 18 n=1 Tax=Podospora fimiseda TaxID=252190 RepID=A0AAN6YTM4_9PEZI|nr:hypothetical protein QBC38DRAFT_489532 [Podospora fimiseda]
MHDIFFIAHVLDQDILKARAILAGVTKSPEHHTFTRIQHFELIDRYVKGLPLIKDLARERNDHTAAWLELHAAFLKQQYTVNIRTKILKDEVEAARNGLTRTIPPTRVRILKWTEIPDPPSPAIPSWMYQRRALDIWDPKQEQILADNGFQRTSTKYEEAYEYRKGRVVYSLTLLWTPNDDSKDIDTDRVPNLPVPHDGLSGQDPKNTLGKYAPFWMLYVRALVDSKAEAVQQAHIVMAKLKDELDGVFEFKEYDRRSMDTRCHVPA